MCGDHDELEIFLEIHLIYFTNRSKVKEQGRNTWLFKGRISRNTWVIEAVLGAVLRSPGSDSLARRRGFNFVTNLLQFRFQKHHDRAMIAFNFTSKRSHDRFNFASKKKRNFVGIMRRASWP